MKKLNTLFTKSHKYTIDKLDDASMNSKSEIARAAMAIGLTMLNTAKISMTDREFYSYINDCQDLDDNFDPRPLGEEK